MAWAAPPSIWPAASTGLTTRPTSWPATKSSTVTSWVMVSTDSTAALQAQAQVG